MVSTLKVSPPIVAVRWWPTSMSPAASTIAPFMPAAPLGSRPPNTVLMISSWKAASPTKTTQPCGW